MHVNTHLFAHCSVTNKLPEDIFFKKKENHSVNLQRKVLNIGVHQMKIFNTEVCQAEVFNIGAMWDTSDGEMAGSNGVIVI